MQNFDTPTIGKAVLRYGFVFVFLWFGINQVLHPGSWVSLIPGWVTSISGMSAHTFVLVNGVVEIVLALLLAFNVYVSIISFLLAIHLFSIAADLHFTAIGVRDIGLALSIFALGLLVWEKKGDK